MDSCLMCMKINSVRLNCVRADSTQWQELNILNIIEKHFWPLSTIQCNSWICSACWRMVDDFHKFYLQIEEAHMKLVIKLEKEDVNELCKQISNMDQNADLDANVNLENEPIVSDETLGSMSDITQIENLVNLQPVCLLGEVETATVAKSRKRKHSKEKMLQTGKIKKRLDGINDSNSISDFGYDENNANSLSDTISTEDEGNSCDEENDKIIADHFTQINCDVCKVPLVNFFAVLKHFFEVHQQEGYVVCCKRQFFNRTDLVDHIRCHSHPNNLKCAQCDEIFSDYELFAQHQLCAHNISKIHNNSSKEEMNNSCFNCGKSNMMTEGQLDYIPAQSNSNCLCCQKVFKILNTVEKQQTSLVESMAAHKLLLGRLIALNSPVENINSIFPVNTVEQLTELDMLLSTQSDSYKRQIKTLMDGNVERNLHHIFDQSIIMAFNVEGILGKQRLRDYANVYGALMDVISLYNEFPDKTLRTAFQRQKKKFFKQNSRNKIKNNST